MTEQSQNNNQELSSEFPPGDDSGADVTITPNTPVGENNDIDAGGDSDEFKTNEMDVSVDVDDWLNEAVTAVSSMDKNVDVLVDEGADYSESLCVLEPIIKEESKNEHTVLQEEAEEDDNIVVPVSDDEDEDDERNTSSLSALEMMMQGPSAARTNGDFAAEETQHVIETETINKDEEEKELDNGPQAQDDKRDKDDEEKKLDVKPQIENETDIEKAEESDSQASSSKSSERSYEVIEKNEPSSEAAEEVLEECADESAVRSDDHTAESARSPQEDSLDQKPPSPTPPSPPQDQKSTIINRFSTWRSKADAAIQNNQMLKLAHKNIEEKRKEVQKVVENKILSGGIIANMNDHDKNRDEVGGKSKSSLNSIGSKEVEDDLSYESSAQYSRSDDDDSQGSSVYIDTDGSYSSYSDDASSVVGRRRRSHSPASSSNHSIASSPKRWAPTPKTLFRGDLNDPDGTPLTKNTALADTASGYKGRYDATRKATANQRRENMLKQLSRKIRAPSPTPVAKARSTPKKMEKSESQTTLLYRTMTAERIEELTKALSPGQYMMLLKPGMLGVNLKQTYLPGNGVYVDMIFPGGNASNSGVICVGDGLVKVGDTDVSKGKITDVPNVIAKSKRPSVLILNGEFRIKCQEMDYLAVAIGVVNRILEESKNGKNRTVLDNIETGLRNDTSVVPLAPSRALRENIARYASKRNNQTPKFSLVSAACQQDDNLRHILRQAFRICCIDNRRLPFFAAFLSDEDEVNLNNERSDDTVTISASTRLMLYLELVSYKDLFSETPPKKRFDHAKLITSKFLLPRGSSGPLFDLRSMFPDIILTDLQQLLKTVNEETIAVDFFKDVESCLEDSLAGAKFASFLLSDACARMRAYLRGTAPYIDPHLAPVVRASSLLTCTEHSADRNHMKFTLVYLVCQLENDSLDKNYEKKDSTKTKESKRLQGSAAGFSCAIFISRTLLPSIELAQKHVGGDTSGSESTSAFEKLISVIETFWGTFMAPMGGLLESSTYSDETTDLIELVRKAMLSSFHKAEEITNDARLLQLIQSVLQGGEFAKFLPKLRDELIYDYYVSHHPKYRAHMIHEWMCAEANNALHNESSQESKEKVENVGGTPRLLEGAISRLIRKLEIPRGISRHCPAHKPQKQNLLEKAAQPAKCNFNADFALVFTGTKDLEKRPSDLVVSFDKSTLQKALCAPLSEVAKSLTEVRSIEEVLPPTIVSYAIIPALKRMPFQDPIHFGRTTQNGWEVTLVNFMAPRATSSENESDSFWYGVSLVMNYFCEKEGVASLKNAVTLTLVSERNVIPAMRNSLVKIYEKKVVSKPHNRDCTSFVESLEKLRSESDNPQKLITMLDPFIKLGSSKWLDQPLINQEKAFERSCLEVLVESLSPIPFSLLFITTLLEQKIIFTSRRRSTLISMISGLRSLLRPLGWSHLIVPVVPSSLANDLIQYPAPFILGIPLDDKGSMDLLKRIPDDITLVDVDVGRVILTKRFSHHFESNSTDDEASASALRSQVMRLAENLGHVIGSYQSDSVWRCDSPLCDSSVEVIPSVKVEAIRKITNAFIRELTAGVNSCCYWIEEECDRTDSEVELNILFDEDRFFHLKQLRSQGLYSSLFKGEDLALSKHRSLLEPRPVLALNMNDFNLVLETFIRGQAMSSYISSQDKKTMPFW